VLCLPSTLVALSRVLLVALSRVLLVALSQERLALDALFSLRVLLPVDLGGALSSAAHRHHYRSMMLSWMSMMLVVAVLCSSLRLGMLQPQLTQSRGLASLEAMPRLHVFDRRARAAR
jgi:hypothetical protein